MLNLGSRRVCSAIYRLDSALPFQHRIYASSFRGRPASRLNLVLQRWQSSAAVRASPPEELEPKTSTPRMNIDDTVSSVVLRPYQEAAITSCLEALSSGLTRIGVSSPTGSGKTTMFMSLIPEIPERGQRTRTLILVSSVDLASQAEGAARRMLGPEYRIEVEQGKRMASGTADV
jgi:superfamily II DNA or RNA helicase